jgi:hypothetical protein
MEAKMKLVLALALAGVAVGCATGAEEPAALSAELQSELDQALAGRTAGAPVMCVRQPDLRGNRSIGESVILFEGIGDTIWVNRPPGGCPTLRPGRALVTRTPSTQLCRGDIVNVVDTVSRFEHGGCGLGEFVPWRRTPG